ncbi:hypothetical protein AOP6_1724 [Desulfuromonas sp. AOP6]|nr:hypothetical protein AOP6_1724 [Desulfuromonas sp. AOP6]
MGGIITEEVPGFIDWLQTPGGQVPRIASRLTWADRWGACKIRWGIGRMRYIIPPGLYAIGSPTSESPVVVTANYKMTYDLVRQSLAGHHAWLLVLETHGINVWCAAGKKTFGTEELVHRVVSSQLAQVVSHRHLLLPILGAPGIAAHQVFQQCGFTVIYAAIYARDLPQFLQNGLVTSPAMRELKFSLTDRLVLIPVEIVLELKTLAIIAAGVFLTGLVFGGLTTALIALGAYLGAALCGLALVPLLLPWLPTRSFAIKGATVGLLWALGYPFLIGVNGSLLPTAAALLILPAVSAYHGLNFTGCTTYTSRSGVKKEMRLGIPLMGASLTLGFLLLGISRFVG